jgi:hypothetical protein
VSDITLPRAVVEEAARFIDSPNTRLWPAGTQYRLWKAFRAALDAALAEPEPTVKDSLTVDAKREPVAFAKNGNLFWCGDASQMRGVDIDLYLAPPQPDAIARAVEAEREAICPIVYGLCVSDNNAQEIVNAIRARGSK